MQVPFTSAVRHDHGIDVVEALRYAANDRSTQHRKHQKEMLRYLVLMVALVAVVILMSIALYYTHAKSVSIEHISSLPQLPLRL